MVSYYESRTHGNGSNILAIYVPRAGRTQRPVFINGNPLTGTYKRNYEGDYRCTEPEVRQMLRDAGDDPQDAVILEDFDLTDLDPETLNAGKGGKSPFDSCGCKTYLTPQQVEEEWLVEILKTTEREICRRKKDSITFRPDIDKDQFIAGRDALLEFNNSNGENCRTITFS